MTAEGILFEHLVEDLTKLPVNTTKRNELKDFRKK